jgi:hypothetical protein
MELMDILTYMVTGIGALVAVLLVYLVKEIYTTNHGFR